MSTHRLPELCLINEDDSFIGDHIPINFPTNNKFSVSYARSESRQNPILGAAPSPLQEHLTLSSSDGEPQTSDGESADDAPSVFFQAAPNLSPTSPSYHPGSRPSETVKRPPLPFSRTLSMPLPSQLSHLQNPHRPEHPNLYHSTPLVPSALSSRVREVSLELADSIQMVIQTMLQISPPQVLDPAKERFSACSLSVPTSSMSAMFTAIKNINYLSANMLSFCEQPSLLSGGLPSTEHISITAMHNEFDIGEMLQCLGDALSGAAAQVGADLVLYHGNIGLKQVYVSGDESAISFALSHIVRQVLNTAERGDTVELGLLLEQEAHLSPIESSSSSGPDFAPTDDLLNAASLEDGPLRCIIRISHKYAPSETHQGENHPSDVVTTEIRPKLSFDTLFLRRILRQIDAKLVSDLPPPELFTSGRTCDLHIALQPLPTPSSTPVPELTDEEAELSFEQLASFGESLKGKRVTLYASADGSFAHHLTIYLTAWGMDVSHVLPESQVDGLVDLPTPSPYEPRSPYSPLIFSESGSSFSASGKVDAQAGPSFICIDDDIDILKERLQSLRLNPQPPAPRKRPSLSAHHRPRSSPQIARLMGLNNAHKQSARVVIMHFTSLGNYKLLKDVMQSITASYTTTTSLLPEVMIIPKPAGPRRFLTALHTAVTQPNVDPFFLPIATSPVSPGVPLSTGSPTSEHGTPTFVNSGGSPQSQSPTPKHSNRPHGSRNNSDRSTRSGDGVNKCLANVSPSPLALPDNVEYFSASNQRLGSSPSSGLVIQSPDGQPAGIYFHPRSKTSRTASSQSMERDRGQLSIPNARRPSTSHMASGGKKDDYLSVFSASPMTDNEIIPSPSSPTASGKQFNSISALSREIQSQPSPSILAPVPRKPSGASRRASSPSISPPEATPSQHGLGNRPSESKDSLAYLASSRQRGKVLASDTNVVPPISVLIVDDNPINQTILSTFMKRKKINYDLASNGQEAVQKWRTGEFHLILMDIQMPVMDGIQATKEIRRMEKANAKAGYPPLTPVNEAHTPSDTSADSTASSETRASNSPYRSSVIIVALTASSLQTDRVAALAAGCNDFLTKPVSLLWLNNKIIEWGSIKALQMWADVRPDAMKSMTSGQAAQARNIADRLHVPPKGRKTPSPTRRFTSVMEDNAAALALASSAGTIPRPGGSNMTNVHISPSSSAFETPDGLQSTLSEYLPSPLQRSNSDSSSGIPDVLDSVTSLSRISAELDLSDGKGATVLGCSARYNNPQLQI
ncbi:hypothetical protein BYT27DRAFT_7144726 [Phlegmacium glaucopus]|nr:hypothetical protein BYT27DRAFT_7144726 [Phlegmacium glaucopus]